MSRIGDLPIQIPEGVTVDINDHQMITVKGPLGELKQQIGHGITAKVEDGRIVLSRPSDQKRHKAMHGLYRALTYNMVFGVSHGYEIKQELIGVGFRAEAKGQRLVMNIGFSHDIMIELPPEIKVEAETKKRSNPIITLRSADKQFLGHIAARIRSLRPPEPYKGKGIIYVGERIRRKAGKTASV